MKQRRQAFTLVEAMVALAIGSLVMGAAMLLYKQGVQYFYKTTEHAAFREESLLCLEHIARDLEQLMVSEGQRPDGAYDLVKPFELKGNSYEFTKFDPVTKTDKPTGTKAYEGIKFMRYHSTETGKDNPILVGKYVEYSVKAAGSNPADGKNLFRNDDPKPINKIPLRDIAFVQENTEVTADQIGASPHAVLTVMIVPMGGTWATWQNMTRDTVDKLKADRALVTRTFHLSGYETFYTLMLNEAFRQTVNGNGDPTLGAGLTGVYKAVFDDAKSTLKPAQFQAVLDRFSSGSAASAPVFKEHTVYRMDYATKFDDSTAGTDTGFTSLPVQEGAKPTGSGTAGGSGATGAGGEGGEGGEGG